MSKPRSAGYTPAQEREQAEASRNNADVRKAAREAAEDHDRVLSDHGRWLYGTQRNLYADTGDWT